MAKFRSDYAGLTLQDANGVWGNFENGEYETTDTKEISRLRKVDYVTEVKDAPAEPVTPAS